MLSDKLPNGKNRILYIAPILSYESLEIASFLRDFRSFGIPDPWCIICDMFPSFPSAIIDVYGSGIKIQYDYYHIIQDVNIHLNKTIIDYYRYLAETKQFELYYEIRKFQFLILKNPKNFSAMDNNNTLLLLEHHKHSIIPDIINFKNRIRDIFIGSKTYQIAYDKRNKLHQEKWQDKSIHFKSIMDLLMSPNFDYMVTFLKDFRVSRSGNSESLIRLYRQWEKVRFGFRSDKGRLDHLKLYQISHYLSLK